MGTLIYLHHWSEAWSLLIPLSLVLIYRIKEPTLRPVIIYIYIAFVLNTIAVLLMVFRNQLPGFLQNNNIFYNLHSVVRVIFFSWYINKITPLKFSFIIRSVISCYIIFILVNFLFFESALLFSSRLFAAQSIVLLFLYVTYFLRSMQDESGTNWTRHSSFLVCTAVVLYEATTFFIFLFIIPMADKDPAFGRLCLDIYKVIFILFCILLALALFRCKKPQLVETN